MKRSTLTFIVILVLLLVAGAASYWYYLFYVPSQNPGGTAQGEGSTGFVPLDRGNGTGANGGNTGANNGSASTTNNGNQGGQQTGGAGAGNTGSGTGSINTPALRLLSSAPVGGFGIMDVGTSTVIRWIDRGRGNIYETRGDSLAVSTLSNTLVPRIYRSWWNSTLTTFFAQYPTDSSDTITTVTANIIKSVATSSASAITETPFQLKGKLISGKIIAVAASPKGDRVLTVTEENDRAVGYISKFDGTGQTQAFSLPTKQIYVDWPEDNTIAIGTKPSAYYPGFLYIYDLKTSSIRSVLSNIPGLSAKLSRDASKVFYSRSGSSGSFASSAVLDLKTGKTTDVIFRALAEACVWSTKSKNIIYCGVSSQFPEGTYPDDWYLGNAAFVDNIWLLDTANNQGRQIANLLKQGNTLIDATDLALDKADQYLVFMNKNDLSLWSLDLI